MFVEWCDVFHVVGRCLVRSEWCSSANATAGRNLFEKWVSVKKIGWHIPLRLNRKSEDARSCSWSGAMCLGDVCAK